MTQDVEHASGSLERHQPNISDLVTADNPSARFGWYENKHSNAKYIMGALSIIFFLCMIIGNQVGHIEDAFLVGTSAVMAWWLIRDYKKKRNSVLPDTYS